MFYLPQALMAWAAAIYLIQWRRLRELFLYGLFGSYMGLAQDHLGYMFGLWHYSDTFPFDSHARISLLISVSAAPLFGMFFAQGLTPTAPFPLRRILLITGVAMVPEFLALQTGRLTFGPPWNIGYSLAAHLLLWTLFWFLFRWQTGSRRIRST